MESLALAAISWAMPSFSNIRMTGPAVMLPPAGEAWPTLRAASSARLSASGDDTSGLGAPFFTQMPMPVRASVDAAGRDLALLDSWSSAGTSVTNRSAGSPPLKRRSSAPDGP